MRELVAPLIALRTRHGATSAAGRVASTLNEVLSVEPVHERHARRQLRIAADQTALLARILSPLKSGADHV